MEPGPSETISQEVAEITLRLEKSKCPPETVVTILQAARQSKCPMSWIRLARIYSGISKFYEGSSLDFCNAKIEFLNAMSQGSLEATVGLGLLYYAEAKNPSDCQALKFFKKAAKKNHPLATFFCGAMCRAGRGTTMKKAKAAKYFLKAGELGHTDGFINLGVMKKVGEGIPQNVEETVKYFTYAANKGNARALYKLGRWYLEGPGVEI
jgi:TPR repeat protein